MRGLLLTVAALILVRAVYAACRDADRVRVLVDEPLDVLDDDDDDGENENDVTSRGEAFDAAPSHGFVPGLATERP